MHPIGNLFRSTIGRKFLMALTGVILIGFVIGHLVGNLQVYEHPDRLNGYAAFLQSLGPLLWTARIILLVSVVIHIWAATVLTLESKAARGTGYGSFRWLKATFASRYMRWSGYIVLAFIVYHLAQFTFGAAQAASYKENLPPYTMVSDYKVAGFTVVKAGATVPDTRSMVIKGFENPVVAVFYIIAVGLLSLHLLHGGESLFQTFGWRNTNWARGLRAVVTIGCLLYFLGNLAIPGGVLAGVLREAPAQPALANAR
jgi:succinate dehydrogenase / fumarate reductase cytochrome b subunit